MPPSENAAMRMTGYWEAEVAPTDDAARTCNLIALHAYIGERITSPWRIPVALFLREIEACKSLETRFTVQAEIGGIVVMPKDEVIDDVTLHTVIACCALRARQEVRKLELRLIGSVFVVVTPDVQILIHDPWSIPRSRMSRAA